MKKTLMIIAATVSIMISCSSNDTFKDVNNESPNIIGFAAFSEKATKADNNNTLEFFYPTFKVYGWKSYDNGSTWESPIFSNATNEYFAASGSQNTPNVTTNGNEIYTGSEENPKAEWGVDDAGWYYQGIRYWDNYANKYQFSAYAPISANSIVVCTNTGVINIGDDGTGEGAKGTITVDTKNLMAVPQTALSYKGFDDDYMTASSTVTVKQSPVNLIFKHKLAKINIKLKLDNKIKTKQPVIVNEVTITGLNVTSYYKSEEDVVTPSNGYVSGWHTPTTALSYSVEGVNGAQTGYKMNGTNPGTDNFDNYYVMERLMIPQTIAKTVPANQLEAFASGTYIKVKYTIGTEEFSGHWGLANLFTSDNNLKLLGGNEYTLTITVGPDPIYFTAQVTPWLEETGELSF